MQLCDLGSDLLGHALSFGVSHRTLGLCAQACRALRPVAARAIHAAYADESATWARIVRKLHLHGYARCACLGLRDDDDDDDGTRPPRVTSVELLKHALGWDDGEPYHKRFRYTPNDRIRMAFFCDCRGCTHEHLTPCGRGEQTSVLTEHEQSLIVKAFQVVWWDEPDDAYVFASGRLAVAG